MMLLGCRFRALSFSTIRARDDAILARRFCVIEELVRCGDEFFAGFSIGWKFRNTAGNGNPLRPDVVGSVRILKRNSPFLRNFHGVCARAIWQENEKFLAAIPIDRILNSRLVEKLPREAL